MALANPTNIQYSYNTHTHILTFTWHTLPILCNVRVPTYKIYTHMKPRLACTHTHTLVRYTGSYVADVKCACQHTHT